MQVTKRKSTIWWPCMLLCLFFGAAALFTFPVVLLGGSAIPGYQWQDEGLFYWNSWLVQRWLWVGEPLWRLDLAYPPAGIFFFANTHAFIYAFIAAAISPVFSLAFGYNFCILLSFTLSSITCYWLSRCLGLRKAGSIAAALAFSFSAHRMAHVAGHLNLIGAEMLPLALMPAIQLLSNSSTGEGKRRHWFKHLSQAAIPAAGFLYTAYISYYHAIFFGILATLSLAVIVVFFPRRCLNNILSLPLLCSWILAAILSLAPLWPIVNTWVHIAEEWEELPSEETYNQLPGVNLASLFVPPPRLAIWKITGSPNPIPRRSSDIEAEAYLGWVTIILVISGLTLGRRNRFQRLRSNIFIVLTAAIFILALGAGLNWNGSVFPLPLPYQLIAEMPLLQNIRAPGRLMMVVALPLALLTGVGLDAFIKRFKEQKNIMCSVLGGLLLLFVLEKTYLLPTSSLNDPASIPQESLARIRESPHEGRVVLLPLLSITSHSNVFQVYHKRPTMFAFVARMDTKLNLALARHRTGLLVNPENFKPEETGPDDFMREGQVAGTLLRRTCALFQIRWIILAPTPRQDEMLTYLRDRLPINWMETEPAHGPVRWITLEIGDVEPLISSDDKNLPQFGPSKPELRVREQLVLASDQWRTSPYDIDSAIGRGWSPGWIVGTQARFLFHLDDDQLNKNLRKELLVNGIGPKPSLKTGRPQSALLYLNGNKIPSGSLTFSPDLETYEVFLPTSLFKKGWNELEFKFEEELRPVDGDPNSEDTQILSLYLRHLAIRWLKSVN